MKLKEILFPVFSAVIPVCVYEYIQKSLSIKTFNIIVLALSCIVSFVILFLIFIFINYLLGRLSLYCGQWVEELISNNSDDRFIGVGIIRYDNITNDYAFFGKTYSFHGKENKNWSIDFLRQSNAYTMEYICKVQITNEQSIGKLRFTNRNEFYGDIWIFDGTTYTIKGFRITRSLLKKVYPQKSGMSVIE